LNGIVIGPEGQSRFLIFAVRFRDFENVADDFGQAWPVDQLDRLIGGELFRGKRKPGRRHEVTFAAAGLVNRAQEFLEVG